MRQQKKVVVTFLSALCGGLVMTALAAGALCAFFYSFDTLKLLPIDDGTDDGGWGYGILAGLIFIFYFPVVFIAGIAGFGLCIWQALKRYDVQTSLKIVFGENLFYAFFTNLAILLLSLAYRVVAFTNAGSYEIETAFILSLCLSMVATLISILTTNIQLCLSFRRIAPQKQKDNLTLTPAQNRQRYAFDEAALREGKHNNGSHD